MYYLVDLRAEFSPGKSVDQRSRRQFALSLSLSLYPRAQDRLIRNFLAKTDTTTTFHAVYVTDCGEGYLRFSSRLGRLAIRIKNYAFPRNISRFKNISLAGVKGIFEEILSETRRGESSAS